MKKIYLLSTLMLLLGINFLFIYYYLHERNNNIIHEETFNKKNREFNNLKNNYFTQLEDNLTYINPNKLLINNLEDTFLLKNIISHKTKLVFSFSKFACRSCIETEIERLKKNEDIVGEGNVILLTNNESVRDLVLFCKQNKVTYPIYKTDDELLNLGVDQKHFSYYFVMENDFCVKDIYIVDQSTPNMTNKYLELISKKHF